MKCKISIDKLILIIAAAFLIVNDASSQLVDIATNEIQTMNTLDHLFFEEFDKSNQKNIIFDDCNNFNNSINQKSVVQIDSSKFDALSENFNQFINEQQIAGAVTLFVHKGQIVSFESFGYSDIKKNKPMQKNTIFRIASMSKPFAAAAIMILQEEDKLRLDDPVEKYLPEFHDMWLLSKIEDNKMILQRPNRKLTIRDILVHTDGVAPLPGKINVNSIKEYTLVVSQLPLLFEPGSEWQYGGSGITTAARIVEVISGQPYEEFLSKKIFIPLNMENTFFSPPKESLDKISCLYQLSSDDSSLVEVEPPDWYSFPRPDAGLYSTASDMAKWMQTLLNKGIHDNTRILSEEAVIEMTKIQTGELETGFTEGMSFGLGFGVVRKPTGVTSMLSPGTFGHGGAFGTQSWADPHNNTIYILMIQQQGLSNGDNSDIRKVFQSISASAILD